MCKMRNEVQATKNLSADIQQALEANKENKNNSSITIVDLS